MPPIGTRFKSEQVTLSHGAIGRFRLAIEGIAPTALIVHGWRSDPETSSTSAELQKVFTESGFHTFVLTLRGHGRAAGNIDEVSRNDHLEDIQDAWDWLLRQDGKVNVDCVIGVGTSYGGYLLAVSERMTFRFWALVLRSPALYPDGGRDKPHRGFMAAEDLWRWCSRSHNPPENLALSGMAGFRGRLLMVWGDEDEQVPQNVFKEYFEAAVNSRKEKLVLDGASHAFSGKYREQFLAKVGEWAQQFQQGPSHG